MDLLSKDIGDFQKERKRLQEIMLENADVSMKRFLALDNKVYEGGALDRKQKELMGLVASAVLRCDDCINYHLGTCREAGVTDDEMIEALDIVLIVGGSITIPHVRRAIDTWKNMK